MSKNCTPCNEKFQTMIGGQALIEGIMMRGPEKDAIVCRGKDGLKVELYNSKDTFYCMVKAGKHPMTEFSKSTLLQDFQRIPYREANEERKLQIIADVLK